MSRLIEFQFHEEQVAAAIKTVEYEMECLERAVTGLRAARQLLTEAKANEELAQLAAKRLGGTDVLQ